MWFIFPGVFLQNNFQYLRNQREKIISVGNLQYAKGLSYQDYCIGTHLQKYIENQQGICTFYLQLQKNLEETKRSGHFLQIENVSRRHTASFFLIQNRGNNPLNKKLSTTAKTGQTTNPLLPTH
uniref:Uncharacterized protein n=1 Tax=Lygus hesperus TaxID=30085 RepID=A0A146KQW6_LYGHE